MTVIQNGVELLELSTQATLSNIAFVRDPGAAINVFDRRRKVYLNYACG